MGFFTSGTDKRIEEIKATVKQLNKDLLILADMVEKGRDYCTLHQLYPKLQSDVQQIPQSKISTILVPWNDGSQHNPILFWDMSFHSVMDKLTSEMGKWDNI